MKLWNSCKMMPRWVWESQNRWPILLVKYRMLLKEIISGKNRKRVWTPKEPCYLWKIIRNSVCSCAASLLPNTESWKQWMVCKVGVKLWNSSRISSLVMSWCPERMALPWRVNCVPIWPPVIFPLYCWRPRLPLKANWRGWSMERTITSRSRSVPLIWKHA